MTKETSVEKTSKELIDEFVKSTVMMLTALGSVTGRMADEQEVMNLHKERLSQLIEALMPSEMTLDEADKLSKETDYACFADEASGINPINWADASAFYFRQNIDALKTE